MEHPDLTHTHNSRGESRVRVLGTDRPMLQVLGRDNSQNGPYCDTMVSGLSEIDRHCDVKSTVTNTYPNATWTAFRSAPCHRGPTDIHGSLWGSTSGSTGLPECTKYNENATQRLPHTKGMLPGGKKIERTCRPDIPKYERNVTQG